MEQGTNSSKDYQKWKDRYEKNWCTIPQLERLVKLKAITRTEFNEIVKVEKE